MKEPDDRNGRRGLSRARSRSRAKSQTRSATAMHPHLIEGSGGPTSITPDDRFYQNLADCIDTWLGPPQPRRDEHECPRTQSRRNDHESSEIYVRPSAATAGDDVRDDRSSPTSSPELGMPHRWGRRPILPGALGCSRQSSTAYNSGRSTTVTMARWPSGADTEF